MLKSKKFTYFIYFIFIGVIIFEIVYFAFRYQEAKSVIDEKKEQIEKIKLDIKTLSNMTTNDSLVTKSDEEYFQKTFVNKDIENYLQAYIDSSFVAAKGKIKKSNKEIVYYKVKLYYKAKNETALRKLISLILLNDNVQSIVDINKRFITIIYKIEKEKNRKG